MLDHVFYYRGRFPPGTMPPVSPRLVGDAKTLLELSTEQVHAIAAALGEHAGFLDRKSVEEVLSTIIENEERCQRLAVLIPAMHERLREFDQDAEGLLSQLEEWQSGKENKEQQLLSSEDLAGLRERVPLVFKPYPGLDRQRKAQRLSEATGLPLQEVQIICDLRPVFDEEKTGVEGILPYTTLKIVCRGVDGLPVSLEALLSRRQVSELAEKATAAQRKLDVLTELLISKQVPVPAIPLTRQESKA